MNSNYNDNYKKYNYWNQRFQTAPNGSPTQFLVWYYNYYYPYTLRNINTPGYLNNPSGLYMGNPPNSY